MDKLDDNKFAHLLQPIRDLAANWDINIANELEDYLDVLESVTFSFEGGPNLNFAEAALLIQGSACVYGKKVEYLHSLAYQALEFIAEKKRRASKVPSSHQDAGCDDLDDEEQFLNLDDVLEDQDRLQEVPPQPASQRRVHPAEGTGIDMDQTSTDAIPAAIRPPAALLALENTASAATGGDGDAGNYRIASCSMHHSGALLLEARDGEFLDAQLCSTSVAASNHLQQPEPRSEAAPQAEGVPQAGSDFPSDGPEAFGNDFDDDGGGGFGGGDDYTYQEAAEQHENAVPADLGAAQHTMHAQASQQAAAEPEECEEEYDPYAPLDPHAKGTLPIKPFKRGRKPSARSRPKQVDLPQLGKLGGITYTIPAPSLAGCAFAEFDHALKQRQSSQQAKQSAPAQAAASGRGSKEPQLASAFTREEAVAGCDVDEEDPDAGGYASGGFSDRGSDLGQGQDFPQDSMAELDQWADLAAAGDRAFPGGAPPADADADSMSYEELCQAHIEAFIQAAAAAEVQTELAARVSTWRHKIQPLLDEQDARPAFDIHSYGNQILDRLANLSCKESGDADDFNALMAEPVGFEVVAEQASQAEVTRLFSAMLQLINNGNIQILAAQRPFQLQLLHTQLLHRKFLDGPVVPSQPSKATEEVALPMQDKSNVDLVKPVKAAKRRKAAA